MFVLGFLLFSLRLFGGGDAKLLAAAGLWLGWPDLIPFLVMTAVAGGVLGLAVGVWSFINMSSEIKQGSIFKRFGALKPSVPYGYAFAVGAILAFPGTWWMPVGG
jgi:prepilin peptidase CpaA